MIRYVICQRELAELMPSVLHSKKSKLPLLAAPVAAIACSNLPAFGGLSETRVIVRLLSQLAGLCKLLATGQE